MSESKLTKQEIEAAAKAYWWATLQDAGLSSDDMPGSPEEAWELEEEGDRQRAMENMQAALEAVERIRSAPPFPA